MISYNGKVFFQLKFENKEANGDDYFFKEENGDNLSMTWIVFSFFIMNKVLLQNQLQSKVTTLLLLILLHILKI